MTTIDKLDIQVYKQYAYRISQYEQVNQDYRLTEARTIPVQTSVMNITPMVKELDLLLGVAQAYTPWALFLPPKSFREQRRERFFRGRVAPSIGSSEKQQADLAKLAAIDCESEEEEEERDILSRVLEQVDKLDEWLGFIIGRIGQFLQG
ncbi:MAG: hypothetical protein CMO81_07660 [Waddliaceae bacterium]|nr:hypothetical protein [Waddliaceae bacterium]